MMVVAQCAGEIPPSGASKSLCRSNLRDYTSWLGRGMENTAVNVTGGLRMPKIVKNEGRVAFVARPLESESDQTELGRDGWGQGLEVLAGELGHR
jgi:hypothetical protein